MKAAETWIEYAKRDFEAAGILEEKHLSAMCFHLQQTWEKALKALMIHQDLGLEKVHDIRRLARKAGLNNKWEEHYDTLTRFYILSRYPIPDQDLQEEYGKDLIKKVMEDTEAMLEWAEKRIRKG